MITNSVNKFQNTILLALIISCFGSVLCGQANKFYINPNYTQIKFDATSKVDIAGFGFKNVFSLSESQTIGFSFGYYLTNNIAIDLVLGAPPTTNITGQNEIEGLTIGSIKYAPLILTLDITPIRIGRLKVLIGGGINYTYILEEIDSAVEELQVENFYDPVLKLGIDIRLGDKLSISANMMKILKGSTSVSGMVGLNVPELGGAPTFSDIILNPTATQIGINYNF